MAVNLPIYGIKMAKSDVDSHVLDNDLIKFTVSWLALQKWPNYLTP